ncbi:unnamed protein product, partial [Staurois parvus]
MIREMIRVCIHDTRESETADIAQEMVRDCRHDTGDWIKRKQR